MAIELCRIDDRLIHGQVVVGWGQPLDVKFIVLVDDEVAARTGSKSSTASVSPRAWTCYFETVDEAAARYPQFAAR